MAYILQVSKLGYKSVAHYLIETRQAKAQPEDSATDAAKHDDDDDNDNDDAFDEKKTWLSCRKLLNWMFG